MIDPVSRYPWFRENVEDLSAGRTTPQRLWEDFLIKLAKLFDLRSDDERLRLATQVSFRAITAEFLLSCENCSRAALEESMAMSEQRLSDTMHLTVALRYVDSIVSRGKGFLNLAAAVRASCPFSPATVFSDLKDVF